MLYQFRRRRATAHCYFFKRLLCCSPASGCLIVAKNDVTHIALSEQFAARRRRISPSSAMKCRAPRARFAPPLPAIRRMAVSTGEGRDSWTSYRVTERLLYSTLVEADLHTGRTHQIRVHFQHIGFPVAGDDSLFLAGNSWF